MDEERAKTMAVLKRHGFRFKKKWGQNFILDKNLLKKIVLAAGIKPGESVVEIGPGAGSLTRILAEEKARVLAVEIDRELIPVLEENLRGYEVQIILGDVLKLDLDRLTQENGMDWPYKVVANLPYYITTPVLFYLLENAVHLNKMVLMVQWEVAQRLTASPGTKDYGALTLAVQYHTECQVLFKVPRHLFNPVPEVDSAVIALEKRKNPAVNTPNDALMFRIIKAAFGQRRKTLLNALCSLSDANDREEISFILAKAGINTQRRGETLSLEEFSKLADVWAEEARKD